MATIASSMFLPQVDTTKQSLGAVVDLQGSESIDSKNGEDPEHERSVGQNVISPGQVEETEPPASPITPSPSDTNAEDDLPGSQVAAPLAPEQSGTRAPADRSTVSEAPEFPPSPTSPSLLPMPGLVDLADLTLHSPSSQIVGTPFATDSTRFEYPFPETAIGESPASPSPPLSNAFLAPIAQGDSVSPKMGNAFHSHAAFTPVPSATTSSPAGISLTSYGLPHSEISVSYNPAHPKLKKNVNPPIPPSLAKKSKKWSLNLMGRRKSSSGQSNASTDTAMLSEFSSNMSSPTGSITRANLILGGRLSPKSPPPVSSMHSRGR